MSSRKRTPDKESTENPTTVAEPPAAEARPDGQTFAERVGQKIMGRYPRSVRHRH